VGYIFQEEDTYTYRSEDYVPHIQRNLHHLQTETMRDFHVQESILRRVLGRRECVSLPDGTILQPPPTDVPGRKIVILGDTFDPHGIMPLCSDASLLVHEATQMAIPPDLASRARQFRRGCSEEEARKLAHRHGHSTAAMAGEFARDIRARRLYLNHFSVKYVLTPSSLRVSIFTDGFLKAFLVRRTRRSTPSRSEPTEVWKHPENTVQHS
jgi:ribonuclease Z